MSELPALDPALRAALRVALALLLLVSAAHKARDLSHFRAALSAYRILPESLTLAASGMIVALESALGLALLVPNAGALPALGGAALLALYTSAISWNLIRGRRDIDCGCAGPARRVPIRPALVVRNAALVLAAIGAALPASERGLTWVDTFTVVSAVGTAALLYAAMETVIAFGARGAAWSKP